MVETSDAVATLSMVGHTSVINIAHVTSMIVVPWTTPEVDQMTTVAADIFVCEPLSYLYYIKRN